MVTGGYTSVGIYDPFSYDIYYDVSSSVYQFMGGIHEVYLRDNTVSPFARVLVGVKPILS